MEQQKYYSCKYLLTLKDRNGNLPDIYISDGNRTAGKSFSWKSLLVDRYLKQMQKGNDVCQFMLIYRNRTDISKTHQSFFEDIGRVNFPGHEMTSKRVADGLIEELSIDGFPCGFSVPLSMARKLKKISSLFVKVSSMFFDEYQDDDNVYLKNEVEKLMSIHTSVARGDGAQSRRVPLYMASNTVTILNPYYTALGITKQLKSDTVFIKGDNWVYERTYNISAKESFQKSGFNNAFRKSDYYKHASENVYLNDNMALIDRPTGQSKYELTIKYNGKWFNIRKFENIMFADEGCDMSYPLRLCFNVDDVTDDRVLMVGNSHYMVKYLREWFNRGKIRFKNLECKEMIYDLLAFL